MLLARKSLFCFHLLKLSVLFCSIVFSDIVNEFLLFFQIISLKREFISTQKSVLLQKQSVWAIFCVLPKHSWFIMFSSAQIQNRYRGQSSCIFLSVFLPIAQIFALFWTRTVSYLAITYSTGEGSEVGACPHRTTTPLVLCGLGTGHSGLHVRQASGVWKPTQACSCWWP